MGFCNVTLADFINIINAQVSIIEVLIKNQSLQSDQRGNYGFRSFLTAENSTILIDRVGFSLGNLENTNILILHNCSLVMKSSNFAWNYVRYQKLIDLNMMRKIVISNSVFQVRFCFHAKFIYVTLEKLCLWNQ